MKPTPPDRSSESDKENNEFELGEPIQLESLSYEPVTLFGLEPKQQDDMDPTDPGFPLFTGVIILGLSVYSMVSMLFLDGEFTLLTDPVPPPPGV